MGLSDGNLPEGGGGTEAEAGEPGYGFDGGGSLGGAEG